MENGGERMGASNANNLSRLAALQERKRYIEETLAKRTHELRQLCVREAELTGLTPPEMPLEPGEAPPQIRRKVGTSYQLPESLVENVVAHKDELIAELELQIKLHANMAEAALGLANEHGLGKTIKRQHKNEYQKHKQQCALLQERLDKLKEREREQQHRLKKKQPRAVDVEKATAEPFQKSEVRHSLRSSKYSGEIDDESRRTPSYRCSESVVQLRQDDIVTSSGIYRLSLNGYSRYMERREHHSHQIDGYSPYGSPSHYTQQYNGPQSPHFYHHNYPPPHRPYNYYQNYSVPSPYYRPPSSPSKTPPSSQQYYPYEYGVQRDETLLYRSSQVLQPHQQYESHPNVVSMGLGGCWKQNENGELVWANADSVSPVGDDAWQYREKKQPTTGVLDRRKNKKVPKQRAYHLSAADKSATLGSVPNYHGQTRAARRESGGNGSQLVRTQSLGSVGAQTIDSVYPSDDASSCGSENRLLRRNKEKEWTETSLDSPVLAPEDKYRPETPTTPPPPLPPPPPAPVKVLEIPAESNPSSPYRQVSDRSVEFLNNNVPKNCTVVQAGQCKPYREETKPFEMSDFYKYSTKFKRSPSKSPAGGQADGSMPRRGFDDGYAIGNMYNNNNNNNVSRV